MKPTLANYDNGGYVPGADIVKCMAWYVVNALVFDSYWVPHSGFKAALLRLFGARVGARVVIKPRVRIKYPWHLRLGNDVWLGEDVWIDNLAEVVIGNDVCISQGAYLLTGNHDYKDPRFKLRLGAIRIDDGAWIGARVTVCPGVTVAESAVVTVGSVLQANAVANTIYRGIPAMALRARCSGD